MGRFPGRRRAGGAGTRHLVNADVLAALGPQGYLVNVGRGTVVDTRALIDALRSKRVAGAGLDVLEGEPSVPPLLPELLQCDNVVVTPHVAGRAPESRAAATALILANLNAHFGGQPLPWPLFGYLLVLVAASLAIVRHMDWWWLAWGSLGGATAWVLLWYAGAWSAGDALPLGLFLVALSGLFYLVRRGRHATVELVTWPRGFAVIPTPDRVAWGAAAVVALLAFMLVRMDGYGPTSLGVLAALCALALAAGDREAVFDALAPVAAALAVALIATWHLPEIVGEAGPYFMVEGERRQQLTGPVLPPGLQPFALVAAGFAALFGLGGFFCLGRARRPALLAAVSASTPVLLLAVAYWRIEAFGVSVKWAVVAVALAAALVGAAARVRRMGATPSANLALGAYAAATVGALGLAATMTLEQAWLTVALSLQLPALAWLHGRLEARPLRWVAWAPAVVVLVRLVLNHNVLDYPLGTVPGVNWVLYGYGLPALSFWLAARIFLRKGDDLLVAVLEAGALAFTVLLVSLEIRSLVAGSLMEPDYHLLEQGLQTAAWLGLAYGWLVQHRRSGRPVLLWGWRILAGLAGAHTLFIQVLGANPLLTGEPVGAWPVLNLLALNYLVPAGFALAFARELKRSGQAQLAGAAALWGLVLVFVYLSLEVRRAFHGPLLDVGSTTDAELYAYSAVWLCYALGLLAFGVWRRLAALRYVSFALLFFVVGKVLVIDTAALSGGLRVVSVAGLALGLLGIVYAYQRFVFPPRPGEASDAAEPVKTPS